MGEDLSTGAKIGITLIILVALIGIVFALLTMMKNITNSGSNQLQNSLDQMSASSFADYDQKVITGTNVMTAIKMFENQDIGIVVKNLLSDAKEHHAGGFCYNALLQGYAKPDADNGNMGNFGVVYTCEATVNTIHNSNTEGKSLVEEYNAKNIQNDTFTQIYLDKSQSYYVGALQKEGTQILFNMNTKPIGASGFETYIRQSASYRAMLIKDASGTIIGVCFVEMEKN